MADKSTLTIKTNTGASVTNAGEYTNRDTYTPSYSVSGSSSKGYTFTLNYSTTLVGGEKSVASVATAKDGYTLNGWYVKGSTTTSGSGTLSTGVDYTFYPVVTANNYWIYYYSTGASGGSAPSTTKVTYGESFTISGGNTLYKSQTYVDTDITNYFNANMTGATITKTSQTTRKRVPTAYTFAGWDTSSSATTARYTAGTYSSYTTAGNLSLYPYFSSREDTTQYEEMTFPTTDECYKAGYTLLGWSLTKGATEKTYSPGEVIKPQSGSTWYAVWAPITYTVTLDHQGGSSTVTSVKITYSYNPTKLTTLPTRTGYDFMGYYTGTGGSGTKYYNADGTSANTWWETKVTTLYACWHIQSYTVTLSKGTGIKSVSSDTITANYGSTWAVNSSKQLVFTWPTGTTSTYTASCNDHYHLESGAWSPSSGTVTSECTISVDATIDKHTITVGILPASGAGTVSGGGTFNYGTTNTVTAKITNDNYTFDGWYDDEGTKVSSSLSYKFKLTENTTLSAHCSIKQFNVSFEVKEGKGYVYPEGPFTVNIGTTYSTNGAQFTVGDNTAIAIGSGSSSEYTFNKWSSTSGTVSANTTIGVYFKYRPVTVAYFMGDATGGTLPTNQTNTWGTSSTLRQNSGNLVKVVTTTPTVTITFNPGPGTTTKKTQDITKTVVSTYTPRHWENVLVEGELFNFGAVHDFKRELDLIPSDWTVSSEDVTYSSFTLPTAEECKFTGNVRLCGWTNIEGDTEPVWQPGATVTGWFGSTYYAVWDVNIGTVVKGSGTVTGGGWFRCGTKISLMPEGATSGNWYFHKFRVIKDDGTIIDNIRDNPYVFGPITVYDAGVYEAWFLPGPLKLYFNTAAGQGNAVNNGSIVSYIDVRYTDTYNISGLGLTVYPGTYSDTTESTTYAIADSDYHFLNWGSKKEGTTYKITDDETIDMYFEINTYEVPVNVIPSAYGTIEIDNNGYEPAGTTSAGVKKFYPEAIVKAVVTPTPKPTNSEETGYEVYKWKVVEENGGTTEYTEDVNNILTLNPLHYNTAVTAYMTEKTYKVELKVASGEGEINIYSKYIKYGTKFTLGSWTFDPEAITFITNDDPSTRWRAWPIPASHYHFKEWVMQWDGTAEILPVESGVTYTFTDNLTIYARFDPDKYYIDAGVLPEDGGSITHVPGPHATTEKGWEYWFNESVELTATPTDTTNYTFHRWRIVDSEGVIKYSTDNPFVIGSGNSESIVIDRDYNLIAEFNVKKCSINFIIHGNGYMDPSYCFPNYNAPFHAEGQKLIFRDTIYGTDDTVTAVPDTDWHFDHFYPATGNVLDEEHHIHVWFESNEEYYNITASVSPEGSGVIAGTGSYKYGSICKLTATANAGYRFEYWELPDGTTSTSATIGKPVLKDAKYIAHFKENIYTVSFSTSGSGSLDDTSSISTTYGTVYSSDGNKFTIEDHVVTATANTGWHFSRWEPSNGSITGDTNVVAVFARNDYEITCNISPAGTGSVTGTGSYAYEEYATLTAVPETGYGFYSWTLPDGSTSTTNPLSYHVLSNAEFTCNFADIKKKITFYINDSTKGSVSVSSMYIDLGNSITVSGLDLITYSHGAKNICTATPHTSSAPTCEFDGWYYGTPSTIGNKVTTGDIIKEDTKITAKFKFSTLSYFKWTNNDAKLIETGHSISNIKAKKWNELGNLINEVRLRLGLSTYKFTTVGAGWIIKAAIFNECRDNIQELIDKQSLGKTMLPAVKAGETVYAAHFSTSTTESTNVALKNGINLVIDSIQE